MANVLKREKQLAVIHLLCEGNSLRSIERLTGVQKKTVGRLLLKVGAACRELLDERMRDLTLAHVQVDEIWTFVQKKQSRLTIDERAYRGDIGDMYLWVALDTDTKLVPTFAVGKRSADMARRLMVDLRSRLVAPARKPHDSDAHAYKAEGYEPITQISTDGFSPYPEAVDLAFGPHVKFGTIIKEYKNANMAYTPSEMVGTKRRGVQGIGPRQERTICTSHVERNNLTIRTFMRRFTRLSLGFSKKLDHLAAAIALHVAHYNFCRIHGSLKMTPAMAAEVTNAPWTLAELVDKALGSK
jgi:IS1 family transposase